MKLTIKRLAAFALILVMLLALAGCSLQENAPAEATNDSATEGESGVVSQEERDQIAVKVGDYTITKGEIIDQYNYLIQMYSYYGGTAPTAEADIESMQDSAVSALLEHKLQLYQADLMDIQLDDEKLAEIETRVEEEIGQYMESFRTQAISEGAADTETRALEIFQEQLDAAGMDMDVVSFEEYVRDAYEESAIVETLQERVKADVSVDDADVQSYYDDLLASQKESFDAEPAGYLDAAEAYQMDNGDPIVYAPEGYIRVNAITVSPESELPAEYETLKTELSELEKQYGEKALAALAAKNAGQGADAANVNVTAAEIEGGAELIAQYLEKKTAYDAMFETYITDARAKIEKAYAALEAGSAFTDVLKEYGEDTMYETYPSFIESGMLMKKEGDAAWDAKLVEAANALADGAHSAIVQVDDMFYILQRVGDEPAGERALADVKQAVSDAALAAKAEEYWNEKLDSWLADESLATYFEDVYRDVGK